jgi:hypothetical protein
VKLKGSYKPEQLEYEVIDNGRTALMNFYENIRAFSDKATDTTAAMSGWEFDRYTITQPHTPSLERRVRADIKNWLDFARKMDSKAFEEQRHDSVIETHHLLADALETPMPFNGGKYSVTLEKQNLLSAQLGLFTIAAQAGIPFTLEWNEAGQSCKEWAFEDLFGLSVTMASYVRPLVAAQRQAELQISKAENIEDIEVIINEYQQFLDGSVN